MKTLERLNREGWEPHLFKGTNYVNGLSDWWGHLISPTGRFNRRVDVYQEDFSEDGEPQYNICIGHCEHTDFKCSQHISAEGFPPGIYSIG